MSEATSLKRLFIGGLFKSVSKDDLGNLFKSFGEVGDVTIIQRSSGDDCIDRTFGYVNLTTTEQKMNKCLGVFGKTKWKGHELRVQVAKEDFIARLKVEREEAKKGIPIISKRKRRNQIPPPKPYTNIIDKVSTMKRVVPGTMIEGEKDWVVGKYGRPLPIMKLEAKASKKTFKFDPSKQCHCLQKIKDDDIDHVSLNKLSWSIDNSELYLSSKKSKRKKERKDDSQSECKKSKKYSSVDSDENRTLGYVSDPQSQVDSKKSKKHANIDSDSNIPNVSKESKKHIPEEHFTLDSIPNSNCQPESEDSEKHSDNNSDENASKEYSTLESISDSKSQAENKKSKKRTNTDTDKNAHEEHSALESISDSNSPCKQQTDFNSDENVLEEHVACEYTSAENYQDVKQSVESEFLTTTSEECVNGSSKTSPDDAAFAEFWTGKQESAIPDVQNDNSSKVRLGLSIVEQILLREKQSENVELTSSNTTCNLIEKTEFNTQNTIETKNSFSDKNCEEKEYILDIHTEPVLNTVQHCNDTTFLSLDMIVTSTLSSLPTISKETKTLNANELSAKKENCSTGSAIIESSSSEDESNKESSIASGEKHDNDKELEKLLSRPKSELTKAERKRLKTLTKADRKRQKKESEAKHKLSDEKRKESLELRNKSIADNKQLIQLSLKDIDINKPTSNRIVFDDESEEENDGNIVEEVCIDRKAKDLPSDEDIDFGVVKTKEDTCNEKVPLDLWSDEEDAPNSEILGDENEVNTISEEGADDPFRLKPQFQGEKGAELFRLQQKFIGDERFRFDERFASGDEVSDEEEDNISSKPIQPADEEPQDPNDVDLKEEKNLALSVLEQVLGKPIAKTKDNEKHSNLERYDPTNKDHQKYEVHKEVPIEESEVDSTKEFKAEEALLPQVSKETYYEVDESLKDLFGLSSENQQPAVFSFLGEQPDSSEAFDKSNDETEVKERKTLNWQLALKEVDKKEEVICNVDNEMKENIEPSSDETPLKSFFFTNIDSRFETGKRFMRSDTLDKIEERWKRLRGQLTEDYKKKHKDALRRTRKLKEKHSLKR